MRTAKAGVILMAFGTPPNAAEIPAFYTRIRRGRPPTRDEITALQERYEAIGGLSPLAKITEAQHTAIGAHLNKILGTQIPVRLGQRFAAPFIADAMAQLAEEHVTHAVAIVLSPHYSRASIGGYLAEANEARLRHGIEMLPIEHWHMLVPYINFLVNAVRDTRARMPENHVVLFSAHSLPESALVNDPYPGELQQSAQIVASKLGLVESDWSISWQSAGQTGGAWRGPDVCDAIRSFSLERHIEGVVVCPQGFAADNLEILFDLDIKANAVADELGIQFSRTPSINTDDSVMEGIAALIAARLRRRRLA